ncbi:polygalacturonase, partial [Trifolium pratense]
SIGSLGARGESDIVEDVHVKNCTLTETLTGVRIKTKQTKAIKISDVTYRGISGTSLTDKAINLNCDQNVGCSNLVFDRVYVRSAVPKMKVFSFCHNAHGRASHTKPILNCLLK